MEKAKAAGAKQSDNAEALQVNNVIFAALNKELCESRIYKFGRKVDPVYYEHMINHYSGFTKITDTALSPEEEHEMYIQFQEVFPTCHAVFSQIVSASSFHVELATAYDKSNPSPNVDVANAKATRRIVARMEKAKAAGAKQSDDAEALQVNNVIFAALNKELCEYRIYKFGRDAFFTWSLPNPKRGTKTMVIL